MKFYGKLAGGLIAGWFVFALATSGLRVFENDSSRIGAAVALAATVPVIVFALWFAASRGFREFALSLSPRTLTAVQTWRILGITFVILQAYGRLPAIFGLPAGFGDMAIGATAPLIAWKLTSVRRRNSFMVWQLLGITDLVMAVSLGVSAPYLAPYGPTMELMTVLPLSLVPTFIVPLLLILHLICMAQARAWKAAEVRQTIRAAA